MFKSCILWPVRLFTIRESSGKRVCWRQRAEQIGRHAFNPPEQEILTPLPQKRKLKLTK